ncbi:MAG: two-component regulator propeller domain-containing protein [Phycisphaerales bacterium]
MDKAIWIVFQATDNTYWFGSNGQGVYRYDGKTIVRYATEHGLGGNQVRGIQEDRSGNIYVCSDGGRNNGAISRFDGRAFSTLPVADPAKSEWKLGPDDLWFPGGNDTGTVYRWDGTSLHRLAFPKTEAGEAHVAEHPRSKYPNAKYSPYDVYTIVKDSKGRLWFGTSILGACRYDGSSFVWAGHGENGSFGVRSIVEEKDGTFWLSNTLSRFAEGSPAAAEPGSAAPRYRKEPGIAKDADPFSAFMSAVRDTNGDLWLATLGGGVWRYDGAEMTHYPVKHGDAAIWVYSIYQDRQGVLWLGTQGHGVYKFNGKAFEAFNF